MYTDKISIIVPIYNLENYIERTVNSICLQTYANLEIVLVNDGSKDNSLQLIHNLAKNDSRIRVINKKNGGVTAARIDGIKIATGDWIGFVDGDDVIDNDMFEKLLTNAKEYNADISHCGYKMVFPSRVDYYYNTGRIVEQDRTKGLIDLLSGDYIEPGLWNKLYRSELVKKLVKSEELDVSIKINEDLLMNFYLFKYSRKAIYEDVCPYQYMIRSGSAATSRLNKNKLKDPLKVLKIIEKELDKDENRMDVEKYLINVRIISKLIDLSTIEYFGQKDLILPFEKEARKELKQRLRSIISGNYTTKTKIRACWAVICPTSYKYVHIIYKKIKGTDKKYEVK